MTHKLSARDSRRLARSYGEVRELLEELAMFRTQVDSAMKRVRLAEERLLRARADVAAICHELGVAPDNHALEHVDDDAG